MSIDLAQEWLEATADAMMRAPDATLTFRPDIPHVREVGWRIPVNTESGVRASDGGLYNVVTKPRVVEFYAAFADGRELTTHRRATDMIRETTPDPATEPRCIHCGRAQSGTDWDLARHARQLLFERDEARLRANMAETALRNARPAVLIPRGNAAEQMRRRALRDGEWEGFAGLAAED